MDCIEHNQNGVGIGYGTTSFNGKTVRWHRLVYCQNNGCTLESIKGKSVRHTCDNPRCINPLHLVIGTHQDNMDDKVSRNRQMKGSKHYDTHLTEEDVQFIRDNYKPRCPTNGVQPSMTKYGIARRTLFYILDGTNWGGSYSS